MSSGLLSLDAPQPPHAGVTCCCPVTGSTICSPNTPPGLSLLISVMGTKSCASFHNLAGNATPSRSLDSPSNPVMGFLLKVSYPVICSKISLGIGETISVTRCLGFMYLTSSAIGTLFRSVKALTTPCFSLPRKTGTLSPQNAP